MDVPGRTPDYDPISQTYLRQSVPILGLRSSSFDNDWRRMTLCKSLADQGMTVAHWRGKFEGTWIGSFAYFDCVSPFVSRRLSPPPPSQSMALPTSSLATKRRSTLVSAVAAPDALFG
jgi:hypothetical protein